MKVSYAGLAVLLKKTLSPLYLLSGQEPYLLNDAALMIKRAWHQQGESDDTILTIEKSSDWHDLVANANTYSLFAERVLLDARFEKKTIDSAEKEALKQYLNAANPRSLILIRAPMLTSKQLQWLTQEDKGVMVAITPFSEYEFKQWIIFELKQRLIQYDADVPELIYYYTQGNLLACSQVIEKIDLIVGNTTLVTSSVLKEQLTDQCEYGLYQLVDACLAAKTTKAIHCFRQLSADQTAINLIIWVLAQEIRQLHKLAFSLSQAISLEAACKKLAIWSTRVKLYAKALNRLSIGQLEALLQDCQRLDEQIKSNQAKQVHLGVEQLILTFSHHFS